jgi:hypothetical protein
MYWIPGFWVWGLGVLAMLVGCSPVPPEKPVIGFDTLVKVQKEILVWEALAQNMGLPSEERSLVQQRGYVQILENYQIKPARYKRALQQLREDVRLNDSIMKAVAKKLETETTAPPPPAD